MIRTTEDSTLGGGLKLFLPTCSQKYVREMLAFFRTLRTWLVLDRSCVFTVNRQYKLVPGAATRRNANSR